MLKEDYTVGWVCALPIELAAAAEMLDEEHEDIPHDSNENNIYSLGRVGDHNVVIARLPKGQPGLVPAAAVAIQMKSSFPSIRFGLIVGIGGGVPSGNSDIRLGDVVIGFLNAPPTFLLNALSKLQSNHLRGRSSLATHLSILEKKPRFSRGSAGPDRLFEQTYDHVEGAICEKCSGKRAVERSLRTEKEVEVHYGTIASGNRVVKVAASRYRWSSELGAVLCFEMEAAGLIKNFPCLVIRGICDYADSHKQALAGLCGNNRSSMREGDLVRHTCSQCKKDVHCERASKKPTCLTNFTNVSQAKFAQFRDSLCFNDLRAREDDISDLHDGTCEWIFQTSNTEDPLDDESDGSGSIIIGDASSPEPNFWKWLKYGERAERIFWITGKAGSGKSTLVKHITAHPMTMYQLRIWAGTSELLIPRFFFWKYGTTDLLKRLGGMIRSLLWQIVCARPELTMMLTDDGSNTTGYSDTRFRSDEIYSWTEARLLHTLKRFILQMPSDLFLCVVIDGLDESADDLHTLINVLNVLQSSPRVKVYVSGRPEQFILDFHHASQLMLQDFNHQDLLRTADDKLRPELEQLFPIGRQREIDNLIREVSQNSEGIFLRTILVTQHLRSGIRNLGDLETLHSRLNLLPHTIEELYSHMLGGVMKPYWTEAATYFGPLLVGSEYHSPLTLLHLAFTGNEVRRHLLNSDWAYYKTEDFSSRCTRLEKRIYACGAGLLQVKKERLQELDDVAERNTEGHGYSMAEISGADRGPASYLREVRFIHRSMVGLIMERGHEFFKDLDWRHNAHLTLLECGLGFMSLVPDIINKHRYKQGSVEINRLICETMHLSCIIDQSPTTKERDLAAYVDHTIQQVDQRLNEHMKSWYQRYNLESFCPKYSVEALPFNDSMGFAAFFGLENHIRNRSRLHQLSLEDLNYLFLCTSIGLDRILVNEEGIAASFRTADLLLRQGANSNLVS